MKSILLAIAVLGALGAVFGALLAYASKIFHVEVDPKQEEVRACLAGANCGGCGYAGCSDYAKAVVIRRPGPTADAHSIFPRWCLHEFKLKPLTISLYSGSVRQP